MHVLQVLVTSVDELERRTWTWAIGASGKTRAVAILVHVDTSCSSVLISFPIQFPAVAATMQLSDPRIDELSRGYLAYLQRRSSTAPSLHPISNTQLRKLRTWIALFSLNAEMQAKLMAYLRDHGRSPRRQRMEAMYRGYMDGVFAVEDERLLVRRSELGWTFVLKS